ncbi:Retrovirus-related Pol polyprotein from type-1 retrotransposable element R2 [Euphorbia peplus]|nr:Retrovirus-related Pol polyprotein from type-1 retrotransposable element R2 [Euphorbia peplus]
MIKILYWNCRGIGNPQTQRTLQGFCLKHRPDFLCLTEPMVDFSSIAPNFWKSISMNFLSTNDRVFPTIWVFHRIDLNNLSIISRHEQHVTLEVETSGNVHRISLVYGNVLATRRRALWDDILLLKSTFSGSWVLMGDFNALLGPQEKTGRPPNRRSCSEFHNFIDTGDFFNVETAGSLYTWTNGQFGSSHVECRLDRALVTSSLLDFWDRISCVALPRHHSDHNPLLFSCSKGRSSVSRFRFMGMWLLHPTLREVIDNHWKSSHPNLPSMQLLNHKLRTLRPVLRAWNRDIFGHVDVNIQIATDNLAAIQEEISTYGLSEDRNRQELQAHSLLDDELLKKEILCRENSRTKWLNAGDRNTAFFHRMASIKKARVGLDQILIDGNLSRSHEAIASHVTNYFELLFKNPRNVPVNYDIVQQIVPTSVSMEENLLLTRSPSDEDIRNSIFSMDRDSAPGPDGFSGIFYHAFWDIVGPDVCRMVKSFFDTGFVLPGLNSNIMVLLPKIHGANEVSQFRPIVMSNFSFKVISKILADRLASIASRIISVSQFGFVPGRSIHHCVAAASEGINMLEKRCFGGTMALKIDIRKAFDTLDWSFLLAVLEAFGFSVTFRDWILNILSSARMSIMISGAQSGYFSCSRGVRQGDPLSPILFGLAEDFFSRWLSHLVNTGQLSPMTYSQGVYFPTHIFYADDIFIFCRATVRNMRSIQEAFNFYGNLSGQLVSWGKSVVFFGSTMTARRIQTLIDIVNIRIGTLPVQYLGVPLFCGMPRTRHLLLLAEKMLASFSKWKGSSLSLAGRLCLIKSVLTGSFVHSFIVYKWPIALLKKLNRSMCNFLWSGDIATRKLVTPSWKVCCSGLDQGGLGIKDLRKFNLALRGKMAWSMTTENSFIMTLLRGRFIGRSGLPKSVIINSSIWSSISISFNRIQEDILWWVGRNSCLNFWNSNWLRPSIASQMHIPLSQRRKLVARVSDFLTSSGWVNLPSLPLDIQNQISDLKLGLDEADCSAWTKTDSGCFFVKAFYADFFLRQQVPSYFKRIWNKVVPPSRSLLVWRVLHGAIPTHDKLQQRGMSFVSRCCFCLNHVESIDHNFIRCNFASNLWQAISALFGVQINTTGSISFLVSEALNHKFSKQISLLWLAAILNGFWLLWHFRNLAIFEDIPPVLYNLLRQLWAFLREIDKNNSCSSSNSMKDFHVLRQLGLSVRPSRAPKIIGISWKPPSSGWLKVNTDGSALGAPSSAGSGGIFRTSRGFPKGCFAFSIGCSFAHIAELRAAVYAISVAWNKGWRHIWLECDSMFVVSLFKTRSTRVPWELRQNWLQCLNYISKMCFVVSHIYREGNRVADALASFGQSHQGFNWWNSAPTFCDRYISDDCNLIEQFRFV